MSKGNKSDVEKFSPFFLGLLLQEWICSLLEQILSINSNPYF